MNREGSNNFLYRSLSSVAIFVVVAGGILLSPVAMLAVVAVIALGAMLEFYRIARLAGAEPTDSYPCVIGVLGIVAVYFIKLGNLPWHVLMALIPAVFAIFIAELFRKKATPFANIAWSITGLVYIALPLALLVSVPLEHAEGVQIYRPVMILGIFCVVWANDIGAYIFGMLLGRHKLFERISPLKTWEGFFGGIACAFGAGVAISYFQHTQPLFWGGAAVVIALAGVLGDLTESMLKRSVGIKDSGSVIPGHGGFLDRFDALLLAAPLVFIYFNLYYYFLA